MEIPGLEVIKLEFMFRLKNKAQRLAACGHVSTSSQSLRFILSLRLYSSFITPRPGRIIVPKFPDISFAAINSVYIILSGTFSN